MRTATIWTIICLIIGMAGQAWLRIRVKKLRYCLERSRQPLEVNYIRVILNEKSCYDFQNQILPTRILAHQGHNVTGVNMVN